MSAIVYNRAKNNITITDLRIMLLVGYTPDPDHATLDDLTAFEATFTNYARKALAGEAFTVINATDRGKLDADDTGLTWASAGGAVNNLVSHAVIFEYVDADDTNNLPVSCHTVGLTTNGGDLVVTIHADGILYTT